MGKEKQVAILNSNDSNQLVILNEEKLYIANRLVDNIIAKTMSNVEKRDMPELFFYFILAMQARCNSLINSVGDDLKIILED